MAAPLNSMNGLLYSLGLLLEDAARCRVTTPLGTATTFTSVDLATNYGTNDLVGSEIWFETIAGMTGRNPFVVVSSSATTGIVTLDVAYGAAAPALGSEFVLGNVRGSGTPHQQKYYAILAALADLGFLPRANVTLTLDATNFMHTIPAGIDTISALKYTDAWGRPVFLPASAWHKGVMPDTRQVYLPYDFSGAQTLVAYGRTLWAEPVIADYNAALTKRPTEVVRGALGWLRSGELNRAAQANAQRVTELFFRRGRNTPRPNEIVLAEV